MIRQSLLNLLEHYKTPFPEEIYMLHRTIHFVKNNSDCFERSNAHGHITGSAIAFVEDSDKILLIHHKKIGKWFQPGGHCDGDPNVLGVAKKELLEETGIEGENWFEKIFDIDIHPIYDSNGNFHFHYDIRFIVYLDKNSQLTLNHNEVLDAKFVPLTDVYKLNNNRSIMRIVEKLSQPIL